MFSNEVTLSVHLTFYRLLSYKKIVKQNFLFAENDKTEEKKIKSNVFKRQALRLRLMQMVGKVNWMVFLIELHVYNFSFAKYRYH